MHIESWSKSPEKACTMNIYIDVQQATKYFKCVCVCAYAPKAVLRDVEKNGGTVCHLVKCTHMYSHEFATKMQFPMQLNQ